MRPFLIQGSHFSVVAYPFFATAAFVIAALWAGYRAKNRGLNSDLIPEVTFWLFITCFAGARIFCVINDIHNGFYSLFDFKTVLYELFFGGLVANGGIITGIIVFVIYFKIKKQKPLQYIDTFAPAMGLGVFFFRIGCFLSGCCFGKPSKSLLAIKFPDYTPAGYYQTVTGAAKLLPSQLFEAFGGLIIMSVILLFEKYGKMNKNQCLLFICGYGITRFCVDFTRFYPDTERLLNLTLHQWISILYSSSAFYLLLIYPHNKNEEIRND